eukprot:TRINITY_DN116007_c0_g1_i1.p1 TRINITY_DN116007_c0_g1~~TRINITY_DN116007_c0_g1_i1.p1  ORF type:complete len:167 (-),score=40.40 TRINITY_DN116007_c0_g1_i1:12-512(-)
MNIAYQVARASKGRLATRLAGASFAGRLSAAPFAASSSLRADLLRPRPRFCSFTVHFVKLSEGGEEAGSTAVQAKSGQTILEIAHEHDIDIEGACGGECACSTCHIVLDQDAFDALPEPDEDEVDMLDLAANVTDTSRLGCQVKLLKERDEGLRIKIPVGAVNLLS